MKFIISFILILLISYVYSKSSISKITSSSSEPSPDSKYRFLKTEMYQVDSNGDCSGEIVGAAFLKNNICGFEGISKVVCGEDGSITNYIYSEQGCKGEVKEAIHVAPNNCSNGFEKYVCVENIQVPSNTYQVVYTESKCENDPDWKDDIWQFAYNLLDTCIYNSGGSVILSCNSTTALENIYNSTNSCPGESTGYSFIEQPVCTKEKPIFSICDSTNIDNNLF